MTTTQLLPTPAAHPVRSAKAPPKRVRARARPADHDPRWVRPALAGLLMLSALAYIWDLSASNYANSFYAAAVQAGTKSWKAFFFGSLDSSNFITVDKPPASLWVMALSGRVFGFSSWSMLVPQALEGVAAVGLLFASLKRWFGPAAGLLGGAVFALTPVAALMFRFNNPDALLVLALVAAAYCLTRALERAGTRWVLAAGTLVGVAFLAKMMQAFLVLPAFAGVYLLAAPAPLRKRVVQVLAGVAALLLSAGWWVAIVALWPAGSRPFIDGSPDNSILNLIVGYNGLGRIFGASGPGGAGGGSGFSGPTGPLRLFDTLMGGQASWLLPAALLALLAGVWARRHAPRTDRTRAALLLWGGWLLVTAIVFSFGEGVIHTYYTVALAPAIGALVAIGATLAWRRRDSRAVRLVAAAAVAGTAVWAHVLLGRTPAWQPWLGWAVLIVGVLAALALAPAPRGRALGLAAAAAVLAMLAGPLAYTLDTIATAHTGSIPSAGPAVAGGFGGAPGGAGSAHAHGLASVAGSGGPGEGRGGPPPGSRPSAGASGSRSGAFAASAGPRGGAGAGSHGSAGSGGLVASTAIARLLRGDAGSYRWAAATSGSQTAASLELASGEPVMAIGGFNNQGGNLTLVAFKRYVAAGDIHYYVSGGDGGGRSSDGAIARWVAATFKTRTVSGTTIYDLAPS